MSFFQLKIELILISFHVTFDITKSKGNTHNVKITITNVKSEPNAIIITITFVGVSCFTSVLVYNWPYTIIPTLSQY